MLAINDLSIRAGTFHVKKASLKIPQGSCHILLGGTGNGKTLILETIAGLKESISGTVEINNNDVTTEPPEKRHISYVPQDLALFPHLTVKKNILYSQKFKSYRNKTDQEIADIIDAMHLGSLLDRPIQNLSGGERQRVALARALVSGNKVLLLDEPFSALHYALKRDLWVLLLELKKKYKISILMVTHDLDEAFFLADTISILHQGSIVQTGTKQEILDEPKSIEVAQLTGNYNYLSGKVTSVSSSDGCVLELEGTKEQFVFPQASFMKGSHVDVVIGASSLEVVSVDNKGRKNQILCVVESIHDTLNYRQIILNPKNTKTTTGKNILLDDRKGLYPEIKCGQSVIAILPVEKTLLFEHKENAFLHPKLQI